VNIQFLSAKDVCNRIGLSRATLDRLVREDRFPKPFYITPKRIAFNSADVDEWMKVRLLGEAA
jgi:excisionase family DNA binding protein